MSDYPMLISNKLHSFRNFYMQTYSILFSQPNNDVTCFFPDVTSFEKCTE